MGRRNGRSHPGTTTVGPPCASNDDANTRAVERRSVVQRGAATLRGRARRSTRCVRRSSRAPQGLGQQRGAPSAGLIPSELHRPRRSVPAGLPPQLDVGRHAAHRRDPAFASKGSSTMRSRTTGSARRQEPAGVRSHPRVVSMAGKGAGDPSRRLPSTGSRGGATRRWPTTRPRCAPRSACRTRSLADRSGAYAATLAKVDAGRADGEYAHSKATGSQHSRNSSRILIQ